MYQKFYLTIDNSFSNSSASTCQNMSSGPQPEGSIGQFPPEIFKNLCIC